MRYSLYLIVMILAIFPVAVYAQLRDFSCYNSCMRQPGAMPYNCNQHCRVKKQELERIYGVQQEDQQEKPVVHRACFDRCISQVGDDALCREECQKGIKKKRVSENASQQGCLAACTESGLPKAECLKECDGRSNVDDFISRFSQTEDEMPQEDENDFSTLNFACFKECRKSGEGFDDCRELCTE